MCVRVSSHIPLHLTAKARVRNATHACHTRTHARTHARTHTHTHSYEMKQENGTCTTRTHCYKTNVQSFVIVEWMESFQRILLFTFTSPNRTKPNLEISVCAVSILSAIVSTLRQCAHLLQSALFTFSLFSCSLFSVAFFPIISPQ